MKKTKKWQLVLRLNRNWYRMPEAGWHIVEFGILKFKIFREDGSAMCKTDYKGFLWRFMFWFPIDRA